jgi:hypothetical protein
LGDLARSLEYHREAITYREKPGSQDIRKVESYTRCISTLNKLIEGGKEDLRGYFAETLELYRRALEYPSCFLKNHAELINLRNGCVATIKFINEHGDIVDNDSIVAVRNIAGRIDALCAEVSMSSDLASRLK